MLERSETGSKKGKIQRLEVVNSDIDTGTASEKSSNKLVAQKKDSGKVDFSKFIKKIAALKQKDRIEKLQVQEKKVVKERKKKGFENLIDQLQVDIREEAKQYEKAVDEDKLNPRKNQNLSSEKSVAKSQKIQDAKQRAIADKVIGQRASRIARLLELWEKQPIEGIMTGEDVKRERERELREAEKEKELRRIEAEELKKISEAKIESKEKEVSKQKEPEVVAPVVEQAITMELLSPLGEVGTKSEKLIEVGSFKTGDIGQNNKTKQSMSSEKEKKEVRLKIEKAVRKRLEKHRF